MACTATQAMELLDALAETSPRSYLQRSGDSGQSVLRELYQQAAEADLVASAAPDDIARLHALFDVALDHGLGGLVRDYLAEVCSDRLLTSSDPVEAFLLDAECVRRWVQKLLAVSRGRLASWLTRGLGGALGGGAAVMAKELGRLQMLEQVAEALAQQQPGQGGGQAPGHQAAGPHPAAAAAGAAAGAAGAGAGAAPPELVEARRLVTCARVLAWLGGAGRRFDRPAGRFFSEQEWRSVAAKRREGAAAAGLGGLFLADLATELARQGVPEAALAYPPPTPDRLLSALFLGAPPASTGGAAAASGPGGGSSSTAAGSKAGAGSSKAAGGGRPGAGSTNEAAATAARAAAGPASLYARLALLAYYLADGGFLPPLDIVQGLGSFFHVPPATANSWLLQQLLDDAHTADAAGAQSLQKAAELVPAVDGGQLPHKALQVFAARGQLDAALTLLRQRQESTVRLDEASVALSVRLQNGLLGEAFMGLRRHLAAVAAAAPPASAGELQRRHAQLLVGQLLQFAATTKPSVVHAVARLPFGGVEEQAVIGWLEGQAAGGQLEAALMLPIYFLLRGRTPEALHEYARHCPRTPTTQQQQELAALLTEAARMLPAAQRALLVQVQQGAAPALLPAGGGGGSGAGEDGGSAGVALMSAVASVAADVAPAMLSVGPTPAQAPLVGSVPVLLGQQRAAAAAAAGPAASSSAGHGKAAPGGDGCGSTGGGAAQQPALLFGQPAGTTAADGSGGSTAQLAGMGAAASGPGFGAAAAAVQGADEAMGEAGPAGARVAGAGTHEFDRVLGLPVASAAAAARGGRAGASKRRWGGSAYR